MTIIEILDRFATNFLMPVSFLIIFLVQLKIMRLLRAHTELIMYYGKQIEEVRKVAGSVAQSSRRPAISKEDTGLYEVLNE